MRGYYRYSLRGSCQGSLKSLLLEYINACNVTHIIFICFFHCGILIKYANTIKRFFYPNRYDKLFLFFIIRFFAYLQPSFCKRSLSTWRFNVISFWRNGTTHSSCFFGKYKSCDDIILILFLVNSRKMFI